MKSILIVGLARPDSREDRAAFAGSGSGSRLERLLGVQPGELLAVADTVNLWRTARAMMDAGERSDWEQAAQRIDVEGRGALILCGRQVARAFCVKDSVEWLENIRVRGTTGLVIPHPSGRCRWWNLTQNRLVARTALGLATGGIGSSLFHDSGLLAGLPRTPDWFTGGSAAQDRRVQAGVHPATGRPLLAGETCETCRFRLRLGGGGRRTWSKCALAPGGGEATDIRVKWQACDGWLPLVGRRRRPAARLDVPTGDRLIDLDEEG